MGFVYKPIPPEIYAKLPPHLRRATYEHERALLVSLGARQKSHGLECLAIIGAIALAVAIYLIITL